MMATSAAGLRASEAQFTTSASQVVRAFAPTPQAAGAAPGSSGPLASGDNLASSLVGEMSALANYRANAKVFEAADRMAKVTLDLIG